MRTLLKLILFSAFVLCVSCRHPATPTFSFVNESQDSSIVAKKISINQLVKNYKKLQGQYIETEGTFYHGFEEFAIYPNRSLFSQEPQGFWMETSMALQIPEEGWRVIEQNQGTKVIVKGRVDTSDRGHLGQYLATISSIYYFKRK